jgi:hypothetical protein
MVIPKNYPARTVIVTFDATAGMVIHTITLPVLSLQVFNVSTGMVIHKITVPILSLQRKTSFLVW